MDIEKLVTCQHGFFDGNNTKPLAFRKKMLELLLKVIKENEEELLSAVNKDLGKSKGEAYVTELASVYSEIRTALKNIERWSKPKRVRGGMALFPGKSLIYSEPYGVVLILSPWNYPVNLTLVPLVGAIAAGNCAVIKCSKSSGYTSAALHRIINQTFAAKYICCMRADTEYSEAVNQNYDYIFFTGSPGVGSKVMKAAAERLIPVSLELGGKSPCIVDKSANLEIAARRIVWGKFLNAGQTCISVDYVLVDAAVKSEFIRHLEREIQNQFPDYENMDGYPKIINRHHFERLCRLMQTEEGVIGGSVYPEQLKIAPAILPNAEFDHEIMREEIFGPLLPIIEYEELPEVVVQIKKRPKPLACYIFTENRRLADRLISELSFGGGCVNDTIMHITNSRMPFGGVGMSGIGSYHGKYSFETFSHKKSVFRNKTCPDIKVRYRLKDEKSLNLLKKIM